MEVRISSWNLAIGLLIFFKSEEGATQEYNSDDRTVTPVPFFDVVKDLKPLYFGNNSDYFISTYATDASSATAVCQNLTSMTGKHFHLLTLESKEEMDELLPYLHDLEIQGVWTAGQKTFDEQGGITLMWVTEDGSRPMLFRSFRTGISVRRRRDLLGISNDYEFEPFEAASETKDSSSSEESSRNEFSDAKLYPWINKMMFEPESGRCRNGKLIPECKPIECNVTLPECSIKTPKCQIVNQTLCEVIRPNCSAICENCTVVPPVCYAIPKPCDVTTPQDCQALIGTCTIDTPPCSVTRPNCTFTQPPCQVTEPPPCTTVQPCIPSFRKDNCRTVGNSTVCDPPLRCEPVVCQSPAILCPPPIYYCPPEQVVCPEPIIKCPKPTIYCSEPVTVCPEPEIRCSKPQVLCSAPVVNCPGLITSCNAPDHYCPPPEVTCPKPEVICSKPEPCPEPTTPIPCTEPTTEPTTSTTKHCNGCGCIYMNKKHNLLWDIAKCGGQKLHFICES